MELILIYMAYTIDFDELVGDLPTDMFIVPTDMDKTLLMEKESFEQFPDLFEPYEYTYSYLCAK